MSAPVETSTRTDAHRIMVAKLIEEAGFAATLDLIIEQAAARTGTGWTHRQPTIKQRRYLKIGPALELALNSCILGRV